MAEKIMKPGVWLRRRDRLAVAVHMIPEARDCRWIGSDGLRRHDDGRIHSDRDSPQDLVEWLDVPDKPVQPPQPQPDAAEELAALKDDRDRWQARAKQAEGQASNLAQELVRVRNEARQSNDARAQVEALLATARQQINDLQAQLEAAAHLPDLRGDLERVAAERDAAREDLRGLQVRAEQAEGDARQAVAKMRHHEAEASRWLAQVTIKNDTLIRTEAAFDALRSLILDLFERLHNDD